MKKVVLIVGLMIVGSAIGLVTWFSLSGPVLVEWRDPAAICDPPVLLLNPLRDRQPERTGDRFLATLQSGDFSLLDRIISNDEVLDHVRLRESELKIKSWYSGARMEANTEASIEYWVTRDYQGACHALPVHIGFRKNTDGWEVTRYNSIY